MRRIEKNKKLPPNVHDNNGTWVYKRYKNGKRQTPVRLGRVGSMSISELWTAYEALTDTSVNNLQYLIQAYKKGDDFLNLRSRKAIEAAFNRLLSAPVGNTQFRYQLIDNITPATIRRYLDWRNNISGNREISYLSKAWSWCRERDIVTSSNPCAGVKKIKETPRDRYVTDEEFNAVYERAPKYIQVMMKLAYLCRMRSIECLDSRVKDITHRGLIVRRAKKSNDALTLWSRELTSAVDMGLEGCMRVPEMPIINNGKGGEVKMEAFRTAWQRLMKRTKKETDMKHWVFHDLKAKGVSDFCGDKRKASGHKSEAMVQIYDRKIIEIEATK